MTIPTTGDTRVTISSSPDETGVSAARDAVDSIIQAVAASGQARVIFGSAPSQEAMLSRLADDPRIDWSRVHGLHMDEYIGIDPDDPRSFGTWLVERLPIGQFASFARIDPTGDPEAEVVRYETELRSASVDLTCMGFGVNGHIAFNEPGSALDDPRWFRTVELTAESRQQQVDDGLFDRVGDVPQQAITMTVPALLSARAVVVTVLGSRKAPAVSAALTAPITSACPASAVRRHPSCTVHLDAAAASELDVSR